MTSEMSTEDMLVSAQELLALAEDDYVVKKHNIIKRVFDLGNAKIEKFKELDWEALGIDKVTKQKEHVEGLFKEEAEEILKEEKEKDELWYAIKQYERRERYLLEKFKQDGYDIIEEEVEVRE